MEGYVLFVVAAVLGIGTGHSRSGIESISGDLHQEDSNQRTAPAIDAKICVDVNDMAFHSRYITIRGGIPLTYAYKLVTTTKGVQISVAQMNGLCMIASENGTSYRYTKLEC